MLPAAFWSMLRVWSRKWDRKTRRRVPERRSRCCSPHMRVHLQSHACAFDTSRTTHMHAATSAHTSAHPNARFILLPRLSKKQGQERTQTRAHSARNGTVQDLLGLRNCALTLPCARTASCEKPTTQIAGTGMPPASPYEVSIRLQGQLLKCTAPTNPPLPAEKHCKPAIQHHRRMERHALEVDPM